MANSKNKIGIFLFLEKSFTAIIFVISFISLHAQNPVQKGIVRTALRPDREIVYLSDVSIRQKGGHNTVLSGSDGTFEMVLPDTRVGGAFHLSSVRKAGYELADNATIEQTVMSHEDSQKYIEGRTPKKVIIVPKKIVNIVL